MTSLMPKVEWQFDADIQQNDNLKVDAHHNDPQHRIVQQNDSLDYGIQQNGILKNKTQNNDVQINDIWQNDN